MSSTIFFFIFVPFLAVVLLSINLIFAPHNPYQEKKSAFECGFHSFLGQNRTQFSISFFIFALLFLLFDLEILLVYPYIVSAYTNSVYGLLIMLMFFIALTLGLGFELGKKALNIDSRQVSSLDINNINVSQKVTALKELLSNLIRLLKKQCKKLWYSLNVNRSRKKALKVGYGFKKFSNPASQINYYLTIFILWVYEKPIQFRLLILLINNLTLNLGQLDAPMCNMITPEGDISQQAAVPTAASSHSEQAETSPASSVASEDSEDSERSEASPAPSVASQHSEQAEASPAPSVASEDSDAPDLPLYGYAPVVHTNHPATGGSCLDNPMHRSPDFPTDHQLNGGLAPIYGSDPALSQSSNDQIHHDCCRCGSDVFGTKYYDCNICECVYHPDCVTEQEKQDYDT